MRNFTQLRKSRALILALVLGGVAYSGSSLQAIASDATTPIPVLQQKQIDVRIQVVEEDGTTPIVGASIVLVSNKSKAVLTDIDGYATLKGIPENSDLEIAFVGMQTKVVQVAGVTTLKVIMEVDAINMNEVVVVGYGTQKKVNLTGAVASIKTGEIQNRAQTNIVSALQGMVPGVTIINRPGQAPEINFRGRGNLGVSEPLYVVDGVIVDAAYFGSIDPNAIDQISMLKDAASSSIYGSRAAYGVVLVTTKKGATGKMQVNYSGHVGMKQLGDVTKLVNSWEYAELMNEAYVNSGKDAKFTQDQIAKFRSGSDPDLYPNSQWFDLMFNDAAITTQHSINFSGGTDRISYFAGAGYLYDTGNLKGSHGTNRYTMNVNLSAKMNDWLTARAGVKLIFTNYREDGGRPNVNNALIYPVTQVNKQTNGDWGSMNAGENAGTNSANNPMFPTGNPNKWVRNLSNKSVYELGLDIKPIENLILTLDGSFNTTNYQNKNYSGKVDPIPSYKNPGKNAYEGSSSTLMRMDWGNTMWETYNARALYTLDIGDHSLSAMAGTAYEKFMVQGLNGSRDGFPADNMIDMSGGSESGPQFKNGSSFHNFTMFSYFGRLNYAFKSRYLFEANLRADASSRFHKDHRFGYFPSFSAGWRISEEEFMKGTGNWLNNLKLRVSYGTLGNINNVGNYDYFAKYGTSGYYPWGATISTAISEGRPANPGLGWERVEMSDIGLDFDLFNGKLSGTVDYYIKNTSEMLLQYPVSLEVGIDPNQKPSQNMADLRNNGFELALTHRGTFAKDFTYSIGANMAVNTNFIRKLSSSNEMIEYMSGHRVAEMIKRVGEPVGSFYGLKTDGLYTQEEIDAGKYYKYYNTIPNAGDIKFLPKGDRKYGESITAEDRQIIGCNVPKMTYGINVNIGWKGLEFSAFGQGVTGTKVAFEVYQLHPFFHGFDTPHQYHLGRWTTANPDPNAIYPRIYEASNTHTAYNRTFSEYSLFNADYFRVKTMTLSYTLPRRLVTPMGLSNLKVYVTGENLITFKGDKKMKDFDPETVGSVINAFNTKTIAFGVNLSF